MYIFDCIIEIIDLAIVALYVVLIYYSISDSYNNWLMIIVLFKSFFIFLFTLMYVFYAWKNWWTAKRRGAKANPNVAEQQFYEEKDE